MRKLHGATYQKKFFFCQAVPRGRSSSSTGHLHWAPLFAQTLQGSRHADRAMQAVSQLAERAAHNNFKRQEESRTKFPKERTDETNYPAISETDFGWLKRRRGRVQEGKTRGSQGVSAILGESRERDATRDRETEFNNCLEPG